jgi:hypothetical protein
MSVNWVAVLFSCNKLFPVVWDVFNSEFKLTQFIKDSNIIEIYDSEVIGYADSISSCESDSTDSNDENCFNCELRIDAKHKIFRMDSTSYKYFISETDESVCYCNLLYNEHFDKRRHKIWQPLIIVVEKGYYKICEIIGNLKVY